jgi:Flp pilus assembly protein TadG
MQNQELTRRWRWNRVRLGRQALPILSHQGWMHLQGEQGNTIIEVALTLPLILLIFTMIFKLGFVFNQAIALTQAASVGAQVLQTARWSKSGDPCLDVYNAVKAAAPTLTPDSISITLTLNNNTPIAGTTCPGKQSQIQQGGPVTVEVKYPYSFSLISPGRTGGTSSWSGSMSSGPITEQEY